MLPLRGNNINKNSIMYTKEELVNFYKRNNYIVEFGIGGYNPDEIKTEFSKKELKRYSGYKEPYVKLSKGWVSIDKIIKQINDDINRQLHQHYINVTGRYPYFGGPGGDIPIYNNFNPVINIPLI